MVSFVSPFRIKIADLNTLNTQDLNASLSTNTNNSNNTNIVNFSFNPYQILNFLTNPVVVIPSPGTGLYNMINSVNMSLNFNTTAYQGDTSLSLVYTTKDINTNSNIDNISNSILTNTGSCFCNTYPTFNSPMSFDVIENIVNDSISLVDISKDNLASGDSNVKVSISYTTYSL